MIALLSRLFIKNHHNHADPAVRRAYGSLCCLVGIFLNVLLFAGKYLAGVLSGSIAITADAFNNLSDAGSSLMTLIGFLFAGARPDLDHPFGHGRIEYISGLAVSLIILLMGVELVSSSIQKIITPEPVEFSWLAAAILAVSIAAKLYMGFYNRAVGRKIDSSAMKATAVDCLSDTAATTAVLLSLLISRFFSLNIDGWCGIFVAALILYAGYSAARDTLSPLLGQKPDPEFVQSIESRVLAHSEVIGIHDLIVHDYGPGRRFISLHAEVSACGDLLQLHDTIDLIERELEQDLGCETVIHMDPVSCDDKAVTEMRTRLAKQVSVIDESITIHDFRIVQGPTHTNLIFDVVVPPRFRLTDAQVVKAIETLVESDWDNCYAVIKIDRPYA